MKKMVPEEYQHYHHISLFVSQTNVEDKNAPKDLFDSARNRLLGILRLSRCDADPEAWLDLEYSSVSSINTYISVPAYKVPATTNVLATPLMESANAPGLCQYLNPIFSGPIPPELMQIARIKNTTRAITLIL